MHKRPRPDYTKIIFVGIPLTFIAWIALFLLSGSLTRSADISFYLSIVLTGIFIVFYGIFSVRHAAKLGAVLKDETDLINESGGQLVCTSCGATTTLENVFKFVENSFTQTPKQYCPLCWSKIKIRSFKKHIVGIGLLAIFGVALVIAVPDYYYGWISLNLFLFIVFNSLLIVPHELGHALAATLLKMRVFRVTIGSGRTIFTRRILGWLWDIKVFPLGGSVFALNKDPNFFRLKFFLMRLAGPMASIIIMALLIAYSPDIYYLHQFPAYWVDPTFDLFWSNAFILAVSIWPMRISSAYGQIPNDGLGLITSLYLTKQKINQLLSAYYSYEGKECIELKQWSKAKEWYEKGLERFPGNFVNLDDMGRLHLIVGELNKAREIYSKLLDNEDADGMAHFIIKNNLAYTNALIGKDELIAEADRLSEEAYNSATWFPAFKGTRGAVLLRMGKLDEGLALLNGVFSEHEEPESKAEVACLIAEGEKLKGNVDESQRYYEIALNLDPGCFLLKKK